MPFALWYLLNDLLVFILVLGWILLPGVRQAGREDWWGVFRRRWLWGYGVLCGALVVGEALWLLYDSPPWGPTCFDLSWSHNEGPTICVNRPTSLLMLASTCGLLVHHGVFYGVVGWLSQAARAHQQVMALGLTLANVGLLVAIGWMYAPGDFGPFAKPWYHALLGDGLATMDGLLAILLAWVVGALFWAQRFVRRHLLGANPGSD